MSEPSIDDIEQLIQELEASGASGVRRKKPSGSSPPVPKQPASRITFSTYASPPAADDNVDDDDSMERKPSLSGKKLAPLSHVIAVHGAQTATNPTTSPTSGADAKWLSKTVLSSVEISPQRRREQGGAAAAATTTPQGQQQSKQGADLPSGGASWQEPNFLPVMHARFLTETRGITPRARWGHTLTTVADSMFMFGGSLADGNVTADFFELIPSSLSWEPAFCARGQAPQARMLHASCSYLDKYLVVFGGCTMNQVTALSGLHLYDVASQGWSTNPAGVKHEPMGRFGHTAVVHHDLMFIFGGKCAKKTAEGAAADPQAKTAMTLSSDVFIFNLFTKQWKKRLHFQAPDKADEATAGTAEATPETTLPPNWPAKRFHHAAVVHQGNMFVHGGEGAQGVVLSDTWALSLATREWRRIHNGQSIDAVPRAKHSLFACGEALLAVGGCTMHVPPAKNETLLAVLPLPPANVSSQRDDAPQVSLWVPVTIANSSLIPASKKSCGTAMYNGFVYAFGGVTGTEGSTNHLVRFLAKDGVATTSDGSGITPLASQMLRLRDRHQLEDVFLITNNAKPVGAHKVLLHLRAPKFLDDVVRCRNETEVPTAAPVYQLEGNSRVKGLLVPLSTASLDAFLNYLYAGLLPTADDEGALAVLNELSTVYAIPHLQDALKVFPDELTVGATSNASLVKDLSTLLEGGAGANMTILFTDPHTEKQVTQAAHAFILMNASETFSSLLKPVVIDGKASNVSNGTTVTLGRSTNSKRSIIVGPVPMPTLAVRHAMQFLYTQEMEVPPEAALPTMMAAFTTKMPRLQSHCESIVAREEVTFHSCCDFLSLAISYGAPMLEELALLTAGVGFQEVSKQQQYRNMEAGQRGRIDKVGQELRGHWTMPTPPPTEQQSPSAYAARLNRVS